MKKSSLRALHARPAPSVAATPILISVRNHSSMSLLNIILHRKEKQNLFHLDYYRRQRDINIGSAVIAVVIRRQCKAVDISHFVRVQCAVRRARWRSATCTIIWLSLPMIARKMCLL